MCAYMCMSAYTCVRACMYAHACMYARACMYAFFVFLQDSEQVVERVRLVCHFPIGDHNDLVWRAVTHAIAADQKIAMTYYICTSVLLCIYMHRESGSEAEVDPIVKLIWSKVCITIYIKISITNFTTIVA